LHLKTIHNRPWLHHRPLWSRDPISPISSKVLNSSTLQTLSNLNRIKRSPDNNSIIEFSDLTKYQRTGTKNKHPNRRKRKTNKQTKKRRKLMRTIWTAVTDTHVQWTFTICLVWTWLAWIVPLVNVACILQHTIIQSTRFLTIMSAIDHF
jgi:hypothetical protein